jgi:hypothetical protein
VVGPVVAGGNGAERVHVSDPSSTAGIDYIAARTAVIYNPDRTVNVTTLLTAISCKPTSVTEVVNKGPRYTCPPAGGHDVAGQIVVLPYPQGFKLLQVELPPQDGAVAAQILSGLHA